MSQGNEQTNEPDRAGVSDHGQHRSGPGEANDAPWAKDAGHAEYAVFDGRGNESVVVVTDNEEGKPVQATGDSSEEAMKSAAKQDDMISKQFTPNPHDH